jgi:hypothetical protein
MLPLFRSFEKKSGREKGVVKCCFSIWRVGCVCFLYCGGLVLFALEPDWGWLH